MSAKEAFLVHGTVDRVAEIVEEHRFGTKQEDVSRMTRMEAQIGGGMVTVKVDGGAGFFQIGKVLRITFEEAP